MQDAVSIVSHQFNDPLPLVVTRKKGCIEVRAVTDIPKGSLTIPLFFRKATSIVMEGNPGYDSYTTVPVEVSLDWEEMNDGPGLEVSGKHHFRVGVKEERHIGYDVTSTSWTGKTDMHPFWLITRSDKRRSDENADENVDRLSRHTIYFA